MSDLARGDTLPRVSPRAEHHWPTLNATPSGDVYLVAGKTHSSLLRLAGFEHVQRLDLGTVSVPERLASAPMLMVSPEEKGQQRKSLTVGLASDGAHTTDGDLGDWQGASWIEIDAQLGITAALAADSDSLYLALRTGRDDLLANSGASGAPYDFTTGGGIDLYLGRPDADPDRDEPAPGDRRLFVTKTQGTLRATLFEQAAGEKTSGAGRIGKPLETDVRYESPIGSVSMARVADLTSVVALGERQGNYEVAIPLSALDRSFSDGQSMLGDIGVLLGDGTSTRQRVYWNNQTNRIVSDLPGEARLMPQHWGVWTFSASGATP